MSNTITLNIHSTAILARMSETQDIINSLNNRLADTISQTIIDSIESRLSIYRALLIELAEQLTASIK